MNKNAAFRDYGFKHPIGFAWHFCGISLGIFVVTRLYCRVIILWFYITFRNRIPLALCVPTHHRLRRIKIRLNIALPFIKQDFEPPSHTPPENPVPLSSPIPITSN